MPFVNIKDLKIYYELKAKEQEGTPLVMIPGLRGDVLTFSGIAVKLTKHFPVILVENIGVGHSSVPAPPYSTEEMAGMIKGVIDHLGFGKVNILGHSMGGFIAQKLTSKYPAVVNRLILSGTSAKMPEHNKNIFSGLYKELAENRVTLRAFYNKMLKILVNEKLYNDSDMREMILDYMEFAPHQQTLTGFRGQLDACFNHNSIADLEKIKCRVLVVTGVSDLLMPMSESVFLKDKISRAELISIENAAHLPFIENPDFYTKIILNFLKP